MTPLHKQLELIKKKFPGQIDYIDELYESNADFRTLCGDYFSCAEYLKESKKTLNTKHEAVEEYENLEKELDKELQNFIFGE